MIEKLLVVPKKDLKILEKSFETLKEDPSLQNVEMLQKLVTNLNKTMKMSILEKMDEKDLDTDEFEEGKICRVKKHSYAITNPDELPKEWKELKKAHLLKIKLDQQVADNKIKLDAQLQNVKKEYEAFHNEIPGITQTITEEVRTYWNTKESK